MAKKKRASFDAEAAESMTSAEIAAFLTERELKFAQEFNVCLNGTQAAIRAGYAPGEKNASAAVQACRLLRDPRVRAYRIALIRESAEDMALTKDALVLKLVDLYDRCTQAEPVLAYENGEWVETGEWKFDSKGALRALEQLSKLFGYDAPMKLANPDGGPVVVQLSTEALANGE